MVLEAEWEQWGFSIQASSLEGYKAKRLSLVRLVGYQIKPRKSEQRKRITGFFHAFLVAKIVQKSWKIMKNQSLEGPGRVLGANWEHLGAPG